MRILIFTACFIASVAAFALMPAKTYQIDIIVFTPRTITNESKEYTPPPLVTSQTSKAIELKPDDGSSEPYRLLPASASDLKKELWALAHNGPYNVIGHYTWLQTDTLQKPVVLPMASLNGWTIEGSISVRHANFYRLNTELVLSHPEKPDASFVFSQKQQLQEGKLYYLDHPQAGMLIKIHSIV